MQQEQDAQWSEDRHEWVWAGVPAAALLLFCLSLSALCLCFLSRSLREFITLSLSLSVLALCILVSSHLQISLCFQAPPANLLSSAEDLRIAGGTARAQAVMAAVGQRTMSALDLFS